MRNEGIVPQAELSIEEAAEELKKRFKGDPTKIANFILNKLSSKFPKDVCREFHPLDEILRDPALTANLIEVLDMQIQC